MLCIRAMAEAQQSHGPRLYEAMLRNDSKEPPAALTRDSGMPSCRQSATA